MKVQFISLCFFIFIAGSCNNNNYESAVTALDGAREFIDGCLKGDFKQASFYMIDDKENHDDLLKIKRDYNSKSADAKRAYATASIISNDDEAINDSTHIINYIILT